LQPRFAGANPPPTDRGAHRAPWRRGRSALIANQRPLGPDGEPGELAELIELVEAVLGSEIFQRACAAKQALFEVPFALPRRPAGSEGPIQLIEGVIDLAFEEEDGWVIVDWKTDEVEDPAVLVARKEAYQRQVKLYAEAWQTLTGGRVKEQLVSSLR
jgi:ATP-dependent exoDNAse (exonuclease V) beta subunit